MLKFNLSNFLPAFAGSGGRSIANFHIFMQIAERSFMKNKIGKSVLVCLCLLMLYSSSVKADDAFVVEEEAVIGTQESVAESAPAESAPAVSVQQPVVPKEVPTEPAKQEKTIVRKEPGKQQETISQNTPTPSFYVPVRRKTAGAGTIITKREESDAVPKLPSEPKQEETEELPEEEKSQPQQKEVSWWLPIISSFFLLSGIARIVYRLFIRGGKL